MYVIVGDSWVEHLRRHVEQHQPGKKIYGVDTLWMGIPGLTCEKLSRRLRNVAEKKPDVVLIHVGANDLASLQLPTIITKNIMTLRTYLLQEGVKRVMVTEVPPRDLNQKTDTYRTFFTPSEKAWHTEARKELNENLKSQLGLDFVRVTQKVRFSKHYRRDGVHLTKEGNQALFYSILKGFSYVRT